MNARQFFDRVALLRHFQKEYFKTRGKEALKQSIALEKEIDAEIERVTAIISAQQSRNLFNQ